MSEGVSQATIIASFLGVGAIAGLIINQVNKDDPQKSWRDKDSRRASLKQVRLKRTKTII